MVIILFPVVSVKNESGGCSDAVADVGHRAS
jgi:hypothetical protein